MIRKKVIGTLLKCYSLAPLYYRRKQHILVAAEQHDRCLLFDADGILADTIWREPGGVMTMRQIPGTDGVFLAIQQFYSPNDSKQAKIVIVTPDARGRWNIRTVVELPHVHRFDILERNGVMYLIACTLKSGHGHEEDWSMPGKVYAMELPDNMDEYNQEHQLKLKVIKDNLLKNHGYTRNEAGKSPTAVISCESGVYEFTPPEKNTGKWKIVHLIDTPASDAVLTDMNGDGELEMAVISPFHGDKISIYEKQAGTYQEAYKYDMPAPFSHSIFGGELWGKNRVVIGHREGERCLICFSWDEKRGYYYNILDQGMGSANIMKMVKRGKEDILISTNRESDEIAMYFCIPEKDL